MLRIAILSASLISLPCCALYDCPSRGRIIKSSMPCDTTFVPYGRSQELTTRRVVEVPIARNASYPLAGTINGRPVSFIVDTGASITSVSKAVAIRLGIDGCPRSGITGTANGNVRHCLVTVSELTFGRHRVRNVSVAILPNLSTPALLGNNVLRQFKFEQRDGRIRISD